MRKNNLLKPYVHALAILENAAQRGGDVKILAGAALYCDVRFNRTEAEMREWAEMSGAKWSVTPCE